MPCPCFLVWDFLCSSLEVSIESLFFSFLFFGYFCSLSVIWTDYISDYIYSDHGIYLSLLRAVRGGTSGGAMVSKVRLANLHVWVRFLLCAHSCGLVQHLSKKLSKLPPSLLRGLVVCFTILCLYYCISLVIKPSFLSTNGVTVPFHLSTTLSDCSPLKDTSIFNHLLPLIKWDRYQCWFLSSKIQLVSGSRSFPQTFSPGKYFAIQSIL